MRTAPPTASPVRSVLVLAGVVVSGWGLVRASLPLLLEVRPGRAEPALADVVAAGCALGALLTWAWLAAAVIACLGASVRGVRLQAPWVPVAVRVLVTASLGVAVTAAPSWAGPGRASQRPAVVEVLDGLRLPDRPEGSVRSGVALGPPTATVPRARTATGRTVVVRPGDSLWSIAAELLPADATSAEVDRAWRATYRLNRAVVGPDPDLLLPGARLTLPVPLLMPPHPSTHAGEDR